MSIKVMEWVWSNSRSRDGQRLVLLAIADCASADGGNAWPSNAELSRKSGLSERAVRYAIRGLEKLGELVTEDQTGPSGCNRYRVVMTPADIAGGQDLPGGNLRQEGGQSATEKVSQTAPVTVLEPTTNRQSTSTSEVADVPSDLVRDDVERICQHLADRITLNGSKRPTITEAWRKAARLLLDKDGRTEQQVHAAIVWCQDDAFWKPNIMSMPKLREKYDQMRLKAEQQRATAPRANTQEATDAHTERYMQRLAGNQKLELTP